MRFRSIMPSLVLVACCMAGPAIAASVSGITVSLMWTTPGDDGKLGTATSYDLRYAHFVITESNFAAATKVAFVPKPSTPGSTQTCTVTGLAAGTYYFAIRTVDEKGNWSKVSNLGFYDGSSVTVEGAISEVSFSNPWPNPARGQTRFTLELPSIQDVRIEAFDALGRRVKTLLWGMQPAGTQELVFDLRDEFGRALRAGMYVIRAQVGRSQFIRRVIAVG